MRDHRDVVAAEAAAERVQADPAAAAVSAHEILARPGLDPEARIVAQWVLGLSARETGDLTESRQWFERVIDEGTRAGLPQRVATARMGLALTLANSGEFDAALAAVRQARPDLPPSDLARLDQQEALILQRRGDLATARALYGRALARASDGADPLLEVRVLSNLGVLEGYAGNVDLGIRLLTRALDSASELGQRLLAARAAHNLGFLEGRRGDVPAGLAWFDRARQMYDELAVSSADVIVLEADRSELLLDAGLSEEAAERTTQALRLLADKDDSVDTAELELLNARALLAAHRPVEATTAARRAAAAFDAHGREVWREIAQVFALDCSRHVAPVLDVPDDPDGRDGGAPAWRQAAAAAESLARAGVPGESVRARLLAVRLAGQAEDPAAARAQLDLLPAPERIAADADRAGAWLAVAQVRLADGDRAAAGQALRAGIDVVRAHQRRFGSFELRARAARAGAEIAELGLRLAVEDRRPADMFRWLESWRAGALLPYPARATGDAEVGDALAALRMVEAEMADAERAGRSHDLRPRRDELEALVRTRAHTAPGTVGSPTPASDVQPRLSSALGDRALVEYFVLDGRLHALAHREGLVDHHDLGWFADVETEVDHLRFAIDRLARGTRTQASEHAARTALSASANALDDLLLRPLADDTAGRDLVVVPTSSLHQLAWRALPSCRTAHAVVTPSARVWVEAEERARRRRGETGALVVGGPGLPGAAAEVEDVARLFHTPTVLVGEDATVLAVSDGMRTTGVAHIASHGTFRTDNAMFSALRLADGPFNVYDLERLDNVPWLFVLPACQAGTTSVYAGEELLGLSAALLALGASTVVAPVNPVPDHATRDLMVEFHTALAEHQNPALALSRAADRTAGGSPEAMAAAASFTVLGAAGPVPPRSFSGEQVSGVVQNAQEW